MLQLSCSLYCQALQHLPSIYTSWQLALHVLHGSDLSCCVCRNGSATDSLQKLDLVLQLCRSLDIHTEPAKFGNLWIVPLLSWHHASWDLEPDIQGVPNVSALSIADYGACIWPKDGPGTSKSCMFPGGGWQVLCKTVGCISVHVGRLSQVCLSPDHAAHLIV